MHGCGVRAPVQRVHQGTATTPSSASGVAAFLCAAGVLPRAEGGVCTSDKSTRPGRVDSHCHPPSKERRCVLGEVHVSHASACV